MRRTGTRGRFAVAGLALLFTLGLACGRRGGERVVIDLVEELPFAEVVTEVPAINLGDEGAHRHLGEGWSWPERRADGVTFVWSTGPESRLRFFLAGARALRVELGCFPFRYPGAPRQIVAVLVNRVVVARVPLEAGLRRYEVPVPANVLEAGWNTLCFRYEYHRRVCDVVESSDRRSLAVGWDAVRFPDLGAGAAARPSSGAGEVDPVLRIPPGSEVAFFFESADRARLGIAGVGIPAGARLQLLWSTDREAERVLAEWSPGDDLSRITLPDAPAPARLAFRASSHDAGAQTAAITLTRPRVTTAPSAPARTRAPRSTPESGRQPSVVIYLVDTLRADRLGCYRAGVGASPFLDELAADAVLFENAFAQCSWTRPSVASVLTGLGPIAHGVNADTDRLPEAASTLAEVLRAVGYETAAFVANAHVTEGTGFAQGFDAFSFSYLDAEQTSRQAVRWLSELDRDVPFLLFVHTVDPHEPFEPTPRYRELFARGIDREVGTTPFLKGLAYNKIRASSTVMESLLRLYDAEIAQNDAAFGLLLEALRASRRLDDTLLVFVSDHGQGFYERGVVGHGWDLFGEVLEVPLVIRPPGWRGGALRVSAPVQHIDLAPTVLEQAGLPVPDTMEGHSLCRHLEGVAGDDRHPIFSYMDNKGRRGISVVWWPYKLIEPLSSSFLRHRVLYDLEADPDERRELSTELPVTAGWLASLARRRLAIGGKALPSEPAELEPQAREALVALGYLDE